jgi:hypothetical protein
MLNLNTFHNELLKEIDETMCCWRSWKQNHAAKVMTHEKTHPIAQNMSI